MHTRSTDEPGARVAALAAAGRLVEASSVAERELGRYPRDERLVYEHGHVLVKQGRAREAVDRLSLAIKRDPSSVNLRMLLAFAVNYDDRAVEADVARAHLAYGAMLRGRVGRAPAIAPGDRPPGRRVRIAFVSADFFAHSVGYFLEPLARELSSTGDFELLFVHVGRAIDETTARLRSIADQWIDASGLDHESLTRTMRERAIDIAVDLSGLSAGHRMPVFARRVAPVQVTYLGYPGGTGVDSIDARIGDRWTDPGDASGPTGERIVRLKRCFVCYQPAPEVASTPERRRAFAGGRAVSFGCFGNLSKLNPTLIGAWSEILDRSRGAVLTLKNHALRDVAMHERVTGMLRAGGIDPSRVVLLPAQVSKTEHLDTYNDIDIALDTFPYNGTTTTCEALVMGVPVVTYRGDRHASRVGWSLLSASGESDMVASDLRGYIDLAVDAASDAAMLDSLRAERAERVRRSELCDGKALAREFAGALTELDQSMFSRL